jgi:hypothetical protein
VYCFKDGAIITNAYNADDTVPVDIFPGLNIELQPVFAQ